MHPAMRLFDRYALRELIVPFGMGLLVFTMLMLGNVLYLTLRLIISRRAPAGLVIQYLLLKAPYVVSLAFPVAMVLAVSLAVNRLTRDFELPAIRLSGVPLWRAFSPFFLVGVWASLFTLWLNEKVVPGANHASMQIVRRLMLEQPVPLLEANKFLRGGPDVYFYVKEVDPKASALRGVLIYRLRDGFPEVITAKKATYIKAARIWVLYDGFVHRFDREGRLLAEAPFETLELNLGETIEAFFSSVKTPEEMSSSELAKQIELLSKGGLSTEELEVAYHFKFAIPAACFVFALCAAPLSMHFAKAGSFGGVLLAVALVFVYYCLMQWARALGAEGILPPAVAAWSQNLLFALIGIGLVLWHERRG